MADEAMPTRMEALGRWLGDNPWLGFAWPVAVCVAFFFALQLWPWEGAGNDSYWAKRVRLCDRFVALLLDSKDLVEVQRAGFLVHELDCRITVRAKD